MSVGSLDLRSETEIRLTCGGVLELRWPEGVAIRPPSGEPVAYPAHELVGGACFLEYWADPTSCRVLCIDVHGHTLFAVDLASGSIAPVWALDRDDERDDPGMYINQFYEFPGHVLYACESGLALFDEAGALMWTRSVMLYDVSIEKMDRQQVVLESASRGRLAFSTRDGRDVAPDEDVVS